MEPYLQTRCLNTGKNTFLCTKDLKALKQEVNQVVLAVETNGMTLFKNPSYVKGEDQKNVMTWLSSHLPLRPNILSWNGIRNLRIDLDPAFAESFRNQFQKVFLKFYYTYYACCVPGGGVNVLNILAKPPIPCTTGFGVNFCVGDPGIAPAIEPYIFAISVNLSVGN